MNPHSRSSHRPRPPWWPADEEWPPKRWGHRPRNPFFRRIGCLFLLFNVLALIIVGIFIGTILGALERGYAASPWTWLVPGIVFILFVGGMAVLAARNIRRMSGPLDELVDATNKVAEGDYSIRVEEKGTPEIRFLMNGFNSMAERLQLNDQQRRNMLADISHELRTPITVIQGNVEGILDGMYPADEARLGSILEETQILARLVDDLRTMALAESGSLPLSRELVEPAPLIREVLSGLEAQAREKGIRIEHQLMDAGMINADPVRIREVLTNLLTNALRYTPRGGEVTVGLTGSTLGGAGGVTIFVQDNGPGIGAAELPHIFDRFYKSSDSGGMGLGLSIAKYIVEAHGGKIWAESGSGRGTKISFTLPA